MKWQLPSVMPKEAALGSPKVTGFRVDRACRMYICCPAGTLVNTVCYTHGIQACVQAALHTSEMYNSVQMGLLGTEGTGRQQSGLSHAEGAPAKPLSS